jgi:hypothetical protein
MEEPHGSLGTEQQPGAGGPGPITTVTALITALAQARPGVSVTIPLLGQEYQLEVPLFIPNDVTLKGVGEMQVVNGLPVGFLETTTRITAKSNFTGNLLTLGNGSKVQKLRLEGASQAGGGNVVAVASRGPNDIVSATIEECELINKLSSGGGPDGPTGGAILACTHNPPDLAPPAPPNPPHEGARITVTVSRSIVDTPNKGQAVFAMNFASGGRVTVKLENNVVRGPLDVIGGLSRPDAVFGATTTINSDGNHYSPQSASNVGVWQIVGGSSSPFGGNANADSNTARVQSKDDQIENFLVGIVAIGGRQLSGGGTCSNNTVDLTLTGMKPATNPLRGATDFEFEGARAIGGLPAGRNNAVVAEVFAGPTSDRLFRIDLHDAGIGTSNQLVFKGTLAAFTQRSQ